LKLNSDVEVKYKIDLPFKEPEIPLIFIQQMLKL